MSQEKLERFIEKELRRVLKDSKIYYHKDSDENSRSYYIAHPKNDWYLIFDGKKGILYFNRSYFDNFFKKFDIAGSDDIYLNTIENVASESIDENIYDVKPAFNMNDATWEYFKEHNLKKYKSRDFTPYITEQTNSNPTDNERFEKMVFSEFDRLIRNTEIVKYKNDEFFLMIPDNKKPIYYLNYDGGDNRGESGKENWLWYAPDMFQTIINIFSLNEYTFEKLLKKWFVSKYNKHVHSVAVGSENDKTVVGFLEKVLMYNKS